MKNELVELNDGRFHKIWKYAEVVAAIMKEEENRNQLSAKGVHLRFGSSGISFVSVNRESPQMGVSGEDETKTIKCRTEKDLKKNLTSAL